MSEEPTEKPKLIIDDDWKERVQSEKEAAAAASEASASAATEKDEAPEAKSQEGSDADAAQAEHELPPASFATLVHSLTAQALSSLGQIPDADGKTNVEIELGKHFIDTLAVLEEKTKGNLDEDEAAALSKMLYELRMLFVHVRQEQQTPKPPAGESTEDA